MSINTQLLGTPINGTAKAVLSGGQAYTPTPPAHIERWEAPPKTIRANTQCNEADLSGMRQGHLTVIGRLPRPKHEKGQKKHPAKWLVRCDCGWYEPRKARALSNSLNANDRCWECQHLEKLKRNDMHRRTGRWPE